MKHLFAIVDEDVTIWGWRGQILYRWYFRFHPADLPVFVAGELIRALAADVAAQIMETA